MFYDFYCITFVHIVVLSGLFDVEQFIIEEE